MFESLVHESCDDNIVGTRVPLEGQRLLISTRDDKSSADPPSNGMGDRIWSAHNRYYVASKIRLRPCGFINLPGVGPMYTGISGLRLPLDQTRKSRQKGARKEN